MNSQWEWPCPRQWPHLRTRMIRLFLLSFSFHLPSIFPLSLIPVVPFGVPRHAFCMPSKMGDSFHSEPPLEVATTVRRVAEADAMELTIISMGRTTIIIMEEEKQSQRL